MTWKEKCPLLSTGMHDLVSEDLTVTILASTVLYQFYKTTNEVLERVDASVYERRSSSHVNSLNYRVTIYVC